MKLSVVIPTYNRKDSLRLTLDGLARQTYSVAEFEVIVVSDGSTDGTDTMLAEYAVSAPYALRAITQLNSGPSAARNRGIHEARHEVIVFLDDDVEPVPQFLMRHAAHHETDDKVVVLGPMSPDPARASQEPAWIAWEHAKLKEIYDLFLPGGSHIDRNPAPVHFYSGNASVRRKWLEAVSGFNEEFKRQEDIELAVRMEQVCGLHFRFDFMAKGLHRPHRTYKAWSRIPYSYGQLDAQRVVTGDLSMESVHKNTSQRNLATRILASVCLGVPALLPMVVGTTRLLTNLLYSLGLNKAALSGLSASYNTCYVCAFSSNLKQH